MKNFASVGRYNSLSDLATSLRRSIGWPDRVDAVTVNTAAKSADVSHAAVLRQLLDLATATDVQVRHVLEDSGLTASAGAVLWALSGSSSGLPMRNLVRLIGCDPSNITLISNKLEAEGLVRRLRHPSDRRARILTLTARGRRASNTLLARLAEHTGVGALTVRERVQLSALLAKLGAAPRERT